MNLKPKLAADVSAMVVQAAKQNGRSNAEEVNTALRIHYRINPETSVVPAGKRRMSGTSGNPNTLLGL